MTKIGKNLMELGKLPPQAIELEEAVLGAVMLENCIPAVATILSAESFYVEKNKRIFAAIMSLFSESKPVDILTVTMKLKATGELDLVGGAYHITELTNRIA
jgi:replicative DNA helicase